MAEPVEWTEHPSLAVLLAKCRGGGASPGASSSQMVTVVVLGPIFSSAGVATAFVPYSVDRAGASAESSLLSPSAGEAAVLVEPPSAEGALVPYRPSQGPLEWPSRDDDGDVRFMLDDSREDKLWQHVGRQGSAAQEVLASAKAALPCC